MWSRNGLAVDVAITHTTGTAEREAGLQRSVPKRGATVGADKSYDCKALAMRCLRRLRITPHEASKAKGPAIALHGYGIRIPRARSVTMRASKVHFSTAC